MKKQKDSDSLEKQNGFASLEEKKHSEDSETKKERLWSCDTCGKMFPKLIALDKHVASFHKKSLQTLKKKSNASEKTLFKCKLCVFSSDFSVALKSHMSTIHGGKKPFICVICDGGFEERIKLQKHIESAHGKKVPLDSI